MKTKIKNPLRFSASLLVLPFALAMSPALTGCSSVVRTAYVAEGTSIATADTAMQAWHDWVVAGHASQSQIDQVKAAYNQYYLAQETAQAALRVYINASTGTNAAPAQSQSQAQAVTTASAAAAAAGANLVGLITQFTKIQ